MHNTYLWSGNDSEWFLKNTFLKKILFAFKWHATKMSILCNPSVSGNSSFFVDVENIMILMKLQ